MESEQLRENGATEGHSEETTETQMNRFVAILLIFALAMPAWAVEYPTVNVPPSLRQSNWLGSQGEGSCVHATMVSLFNWQGRPQLAAWWKAHNGDGEWAEDLAAK